MSIRLFFICIGIILSLFTADAYSGGAREIELNDGSVITGEVVSLSGGVYTIKSDSLGVIKIEEAKIRAIRARNASGASPDANVQTQRLQEKMMSDKEIMGMIQSLQNDPEFQKILQDPEVMKAVSSGDTAALMSNPQFMKLLSHSSVKDITNKVKE